MSNDRCKCGSYALNEYPDSGLCDRCYWYQKVVVVRNVYEKYKHMDKILCDFQTEDFKGEMIRDFWLSIRAAS